MIILWDICMIQSFIKPIFKEVFLFQCFWTIFEELEKKLRELITIDNRTFWLREANSLVQLRHCDHRCGLLPNLLLRRRFCTHQWKNPYNIDSIEANLSSLFLSCSFNFHNCSPDNHFLLQLRTNALHFKLSVINIKTQKGRCLLLSKFKHNSTFV